MALTPPTVEELGTFRREDFAAGDETTYAGSVLAQATDAVWMTTGLEEYPSDERAARITRYAIMQFALWLMAQDEHRDEINSPFSSERIGSYSYSKMQQASRGEETGIYWLDMLFSMLRTPTDGTQPWATSENVFNPCGLSFEELDGTRTYDFTLHDFYGG